MKIPKRIEPLVEDGLVDKILRQLKSGKEATVYVVQCGDKIRCAKIYKEASQRGDYIPGTSNRVVTISGNTLQDVEHAQNLVNQRLSASFLRSSSSSELRHFKDG